MRTFLIELYIVQSLSVIPEWKLSENLYSFRVSKRVDAREDSRMIKRKWEWDDKRDGPKNEKKKGVKE